MDVFRITLHPLLQHLRQTARHYSLLSSSTLDIVLEILVPLRYPLYLKQNAWNPLKLLIRFQSLRIQLYCIALKREHLNDIGGPCHLF